MANPKLAMIPTGYKAGKVYSVLPESGVGDFTFDRDSKATRVNEDGLIEVMNNDVPRLDYTDGGCPSLLLEPESTNLVTYSEDFTQWQQGGGITVTAESTISPDGTLNAEKIEKTSQSYCYVRTEVDVGSLSVMSVFVKKGNYRYIGVRNNDSSHNVFDFDTKSFVKIQPNHNVSFEEFPNDWFRLIDARTISTNTSVYRGVSLTTEDGSEVSNLIPLNAFNYVWGAMVEEQEYATSYIPTNGTAVTRVGEICTDAGDATTFNDSEGVLMAEIKKINETTATSSIVISDGSTANRVQIALIKETNLINGYIQSGSSGTIITSNVPDFKSMNKVLVKYNTTQVTLWINGFQANTVIGNYTWSNGTLNELSFEIGTGAEKFYGNTKQIQYFDSALTDAELETLTSWASFTEMANGQNYTII